MKTQVEDHKLSDRQKLIIREMYLKQGLNDLTIAKRLHLHIDHVKDELVAYGVRFPKKSLRVKPKSKYRCPTIRYRRKTLLVMKVLIQKGANKLKVAKRYGVSENFLDNIDFHLTRATDIY